MAALRLLWLDDLTETLVRASISYSNFLPLFTVVRPLPSPLPGKLGKPNESRDTQALCANAECQGHLANTRQSLIQGPDTRPVLYPTQLLLLFLPWSLGVGVAMTATQPIPKGAQQGSPYKSPLPRKLKTDLEVRKGF